MSTVSRLLVAAGDQQSGDRDRGASGGTLHNQPTLSSQHTQHKHRKYTMINKIKKYLLDILIKYLLHIFIISRYFKYLRKTSKSLTERNHSDFSIQ